VIPDAFFFQKFDPLCSAGTLHDRIEVAVSQGQFWSAAARTADNAKDIKQQMTAVSRFAAPAGPILAILMPPDIMS
jgi:hypothetical protein